MLNLGSRNVLIHGRCYVLVCSLRKLLSTGSYSPYYENRKLVWDCTPEIENRKLVRGWELDVVSRKLFRICKPEVIP